MEGAQRMYMMRHTRTTILAAAAMGAMVGLQPALAADEDTDDGDDPIPGEISAGVALTSDYIFRGISQTNHEPAIQGNLEYSIDTGVADTSAYAGFWGSNVNFEDGDEAQVEIDVLFGVRGDVGDSGLSWDLGALYYAYPGASSSLDYDYWEIPLQVDYAINDLVSVNAAYFFSPDYFGSTGLAHYVSGGASITPPLPFKGFDLAFDGSVGYQWIEDNSRAGVEDYLNWSLGATVTVKNIDFSVAYTDTDLSKSDCFSNTNLCDGRVVFTVATSF